MRLWLPLLVTLGAAAAYACSSADAPRPPSSTSDGDGGSDAGHADAHADANASPTVCEVTRALTEKCGEDLLCGSDYDAWCDAKDKSVNSEAYRRAELACLPDNDCDATARSDCEYRSYASATPTAAQEALVEAYCQTCEPSDVAGCSARSTTYDPAGGPAKVPDIFVAAWELADPVVDEIRSKCTGAGLDAGAADTAACAKAFASCAAGPYLDAVPDCP